MERHRQTVGYYDATGLTAPQRDELIVRLRRKGYSYRTIGKAGRDVAPRGSGGPAPNGRARAA